jgi:superfamily II DNA or RNA helicase
MDAASLATLTASLPFDVNPWSVEAVAITSIDFLKQPEVLHGLAMQLWDVLIVDEAHQATIASQRYGAIDALARRARHVLLLTATPHAGDDAAYHALCAIGKVTHNEPILLFRRAREATGPRRSRRVHLLPVAPTQDSVSMHRLLDAYLAQLWAIARASGKYDVQLVAMVLAKRAFSSARSLAMSLERRLAGLAGESAGGPAQAALPFGLEEASDDALLPMAPAFDRIDDERVVLRQLLDAAASAQRREPKMRALRRIITRVPEPLIVFTEYRDTLEAIRDAVGNLRQITTLHGGQTSRERLQSVHVFTSGAADLMLATDAGSEGLNLQGTCRLVVNLELPWNPIRLEQRIGRVDRIGQSRTVHAINLIADGTAERGVLASLLRRIDRIRMSEIEIAACVITHTPALPRSVPVASCTQTIDLSVEARSAAHHIADQRRFSTLRSHFRESAVPVTVVKSTGGSLIAFYRIRFVTRTGRLLESRLLPVRLPLPHLQCRGGRKDARALAKSLIDRFGMELAGHAHAHAEERARTIAGEAAGCLSAAAARERGMIDSAKAEVVPWVQAGLFDSSALKQRLASDGRYSDVQRDSSVRTDLLEGGSTVRLAHSPELAMLLILCSPA